MALTVEPLALADVLLVRARVHADERGALQELVRDSELARLGLPRMVQSNFSRSRQGVLRGLHYQRAPHVQAKLVRCTHGRIFDVAVDVRPGSASFGRWISAELDGRGDAMMFVPAGFAHGFCVLSEEAHVLYFMSDEYAPETEGAIRWNDPQIGIRWPVASPTVSARDRAAPLLAHAQL